MNYMQSSLRIRQLLAKASNTDPSDWYLCLKARYGMQLIFKSILETEGKGEVITQSYTCITAINPIITAGLTPVYDDINPNFLATTDPNPKLYKENKTKAIVMQHTLGIMGDKSSLVKFAKQRKLILIEDSAHCLTRMLRGKDQQIVADFSVHSFGVEKVLTRTKFGGAIYINPRLRETNKNLYEIVTKSFHELKQPGSMTGIKLKNYRLNNAIIQHAPSSLKMPIRDFSIKTHILEPAVSPIEQTGKQGRAYAPNLWVNQKILEHLPTLPLNYDRRLANVAKYNKKLKSTKFAALSKLEEPMLCYPILFEDSKQANKAYALLSSSGFFVRRWYSPLLYPGPESTRVYNYNPQKTPIAEDISRRTLCLPTDIKAEDCDRLISMINDPKKS